MKKVILWVMVISLALVTVRIFWYLASPLWIDVEVSEQIDAPDAAIQTTRTGVWRGIDRFHQAEGRAEIVDVDGSKVLRFKDFSVSNGPDLYIWATTDKTETSADVKSSEYVELGRLKGNVGDQFYEFPEGVDPADYKTVTVWCRRFGALFAYAHLE